MQHFQFFKTTGLSLIVVPSVFLFLVGCGEFRAAQHPDELISGGRGISSVDQLDQWVDSTNNNPRYRRATVSRSNRSLNLKQQPQLSSESSVVTLKSGDQLFVSWPLNVVNNHVQVFVDGHHFWVLYKDSRGQKTLSLLENQAIPERPVAGFEVIRPEQPRPGPVIGGEPLGESFMPVGLQTIELSSSAINEAHRAIKEFHLHPDSVHSCQFDPLVGNNGSRDNCYEMIVISSQLSQALSTHGYQCAQQASRKAFGKQANKLLFHSAAAGQVRRDRRVSGSGKKSMHATGSALDLFGISLFFSNGGKRKVTLHKNHVDGSSQKEKQNYQFYWSFVNCWRGRIKSTSSCNCSDRLSGALTYLYNSAHHNHVHMSVPFCERSRFNVSCV